MATDVDLQIGLNMEIGSVPVSLKVATSQMADKTVYTFNGCVQDAVIPLGKFFSYVGQQFLIDVQLPPEIDLEALVNYVVGQVTYTKPSSGSATTEMGIAAQFELVLGKNDSYVFNFYADTLIGGGSPETGNPYVVGASIALNLDFAKLPLVGKIPGFNDLTLTNVGFSYTNDNGKTPFTIPTVATSANPLYTRDEPDAKSSKSYQIVKSGNQQSFKLNSKGFALTAGFNKKSSGEVLDNWALPLSLPSTTPPTENTPPASYSPGKTSPPSGPVHWVDINKTFGPVDLKKIGLNYSEGEATFGFTAGFTVGGFAMELDGLTITFPLPLPGQPAGNQVSFDLQGMALDYHKGNFEIGGAFMKVVQDNLTNYYGQAILKFSNFGFKALGGYTDADPASFFLYMNINVPIGGPPYLFITGLAGGFGINNSLKLPTIETLPGYLLLPRNAPPEQGSALSTINNVLPQLQSIFVYQPGEYWVAAGIQFTSFEMIEAFALVVVSFGVDLQVGILGSCAMTFPKGSPYPVAYVEIDMVASFTPSTGLLAVAGKLSPASFIYGGFCKLSGGFAFYIWFSGEHAGQFVVTIGGYHPAFSKPDYYPSVPRLGMAFGLGPFQVTGQAYFALTPAMMMAGISMSAVWDSGPIKAWMNAGIDFLLAWAPFHYEASAYVNIGCSVDLGLVTLNVHVGADLYVWGPEFGGQAHVDLDVVSFTIEFGASQTPVAPVGWESFKTNFLPQNSVPAGQQAMNAAALQANAGPVTNIIKASVSRGLQSTDVSGLDWVVDPNRFELTTNSTIPANNAQWGLSTSSLVDLPNSVDAYNPAETDYSSSPYLSLPATVQPFSGSQVWNPELNIGPMDQDNIQSYHQVSLKKRSGSGDFDSFITEVSVQPLLSGSCTALWAKNKPQKSANDPNMVHATLVGLLLKPVLRKPSTVNDVPLLQLIFSEGFSTGFTFQKASVNPAYTVSSQINDREELIISVGGSHSETLTNQNFILSSLNDSWVSSQRASLLDDLTANGFSTYTSDQVDVAAMATEKALTDWPNVGMLGSNAA
ncbi:DUF6603 domain-containing protein [Algoriphagus resistens]|uniref:DUF6603 domain-containing protein n=1 Tax=Algoriphagus resistens TaxID=1750590 RepID=UPI0007169BF1|nr:DUF6603 domain-containing protein [Algoriphagus resistens]